MCVGEHGRGLRERSKGGGRDGRVPAVEAAPTRRNRYCCDIVMSATGGGATRGRTPMTATRRPCAPGKETQWPTGQPDALRRPRRRSPWTPRLPPRSPSPTATTSTPKTTAAGHAPPQKAADAGRAQSSRPQGPASAPPPLPPRGPRPRLPGGSASSRRNHGLRCVRRARLPPRFASLASLGIPVFFHLVVVASFPLCRSPPLARISPHRRAPLAPWPPGTPRPMAGGPARRFSSRR